MKAEKLRSSIFALKSNSLYFAAHVFYKIQNSTFHILFSKGPSSLKYPDVFKNGEFSSVFAFRPHVDGVSSTENGSLLSRIDFFVKYG